MGGEGVHSRLLGPLPLWAAGRWPQGSGWSEYPLVKCSEGMAPDISPEPPSPHPGVQTHSHHLFNLLPGPLVITSLLIPQLYTAFSLENKRRPGPSWVTLSHGKH